MLVPYFAHIFISVPLAHRFLLFAMFYFHIPNLTCGGCAKTVTRILHGVDPQARVETDPPRREARVESTLDKHAFLEALSDAGYPEGR